MNDKIIFIHPFKVGGTSLMSFISNNFDFEDILPQDYFNHTFEYLGQEELLNERAYVMEKYKLIMGHLKGWSVFEKNDYYKISLLRDPVKRVISRYNHLKSTPEQDYIRSSEAQKKMIDIVRSNDLKDVLKLSDENIDFNFKDHQFKMLSSGEKDKSIDEIIASFNMIGVLEKIDAFYTALADRFNLNYQLNNSALNTGNYSYLLNQEVREEIEEFNKKDVILYNEVCKLW
ncbi:sulfotransferase family 2 domain-containing protein [Marinomonas dokdonensis]|uniref:sulfotransferase family 2 domain-containing protein n=1 Tax=Marinomonas dokdonensis TaxID=328224 RepID=UPI0040559637